MAHPLLSSAGRTARRVIPAALAVAVTLGALPAAAAGAPAAEETRAAGDSPDAVAHLIDTLGLHVAPQPVRERPGWRPPRVVLIGRGEELHELLPQLQQAAPGVRLVEISAATPRDIAAADAAIGDCSPEVLARAQHLQWIQWGAAGVERCGCSSRWCVSVAPLITNTQRTAAPSMAEHVLALMLALSRHLPLVMRDKQQAHWGRWDQAPRLIRPRGQDAAGRRPRRDRHRGREPRARASNAHHRYARQRPQPGPDYVELSTWDFRTSC